MNCKKYVIHSLCVVFAILLISWKPGISRATRSSDDGVFLDVLARDTWTYLSSDWATDKHLPWSWRSSTLLGGDYVNPAEIGLYALSWIGAYEMHRSWSPEWSQVEAEVIAVLDQLRAWQTGSQTYQPHGPNAYDDSVFYQWYWLNSSNSDPPVVGNDDEDKLVPSVDNAWLAASLITIREYGEANGHSLLTQKAAAVLDDMDFTIWYNIITRRFCLGTMQNPKSQSEADFYSNETRIINFVARAMGQLTPEEFKLSLTALAMPRGTYDGITVEKVAWDGALFTYLAPALFIREIGRIFTTSYASNTIIPAIEAQIVYARNQGYSAWGLSDCFGIGTGDYQAKQGARPLPEANIDPPEGHQGLVTPYASALALITPISSEAIMNLQVISDTFPSAYDQDQHYGFRDSVMVSPGTSEYGMPSDRFSALAQEWIFLSIANAETSFIWKYFYKADGVMQAHVEMFPNDVMVFNSITNQELGLRVENGTSLTRFGTIDADTITDTINKPENLIYGLLDMEITVKNSGDSAKVIISLPDPAPKDYRWYKYSVDNTWYDFSDYTAFNAARDQVTLTLTDGGTGDDDGSANGVIVDPSGLGSEAATPTPSRDLSTIPSSVLSTTSSSDDGDGNGCFIASAARSSATTAFFNSSKH